MTRHRLAVLGILVLALLLPLLADPRPGHVLITSRGRWQQLSPEGPSSWRVLASRTLDGREVVVVGALPP
jgi:hypothetical protein